MLTLFQESRKRRGAGGFLWHSAHKQSKRHTSTHKWTQMLALNWPSKSLIFFAFPVTFDVQGHSRLESRGSGQKGYILPVEHCYLFQIRPFLEENFLFFLTSPSYLPPSLFYLWTQALVWFTVVTEDLLLSSCFSSLPHFLNSLCAQMIPRLLQSRTGFLPFALFFFFFSSSVLKSSDGFGLMDPSSHDSAWHLNVLSVMLLSLAFIFSIYYLFFHKTACSFNDRFSCSVN